jgi:transposase
MLAVRAALRPEFNGFEKRLRAMVARSDMRARLLMFVPGIGTIVALTYAAAIDDPARFTSSKTVGGHFGLTPTRYQSGETDRIGRIPKIGDASVLAMLIRCRMKATLRASATLAFLMPARLLAIRITQLLRAVQPLIGLMMMWALS